MDVSLPFASMDLEEDRPILTLVTAGLYLALILLLPALVEAARRGCLAVGTYLAASHVAPSREGERHGGPFARFDAVGDTPWPDPEESAHRGFFG